MLNGRTLTLHGSRVHYTERGERDAPVVVMLHGVTGHARTRGAVAGVGNQRRSRKRVA